MVPYRRNAEMPLLPYERQLIEALGCTEQEYREFIQWRERRAYARPAGYEHVPDTQMIGVDVLVSLVIGVLLTAASYLLTPKPKLDSPGSSRQKQLGSISGLANYAPTQGFESIQDLASYGNVVPIAFTRREDHPEGFSTGGLVISPSLVWSRMESWGGFQLLNMVAVAGQGPMEKPDRAGIFIGNNAFDGIFETQFQFYWRAGADVSSRLLGKNLRYGTMPRPPVPSSEDDAFVCPTRAGVQDTGFSGAFTPSNQAQFGVYAGIPNGTPIRPNWEIIPVLDDSDDNARDQAISNQKKFVEPVRRDEHPYGGGVKSGSRVKSGMPGIGRNFARHVGVVSHNGYSMAEPSGYRDQNGHFRWSSPITEARTVEEGDTIEVYVGYGRQDTEPFSALGDAVPVSLDDIRSATDAEAVQFDRAFSLGATFMIGRTMWQVIERDNRVFNPGQDHIVVKLRCLETWTETQNKIGLVAKTAIRQGDALPSMSDIDETWYPLMRVEFGAVRNTRPCDVTEIGLKSQVWTRFNGITNFNTIPKPYTLYRYNKKNIQVREGKNTSYGHRVSFFALDVRPADSENYRSYNKNDGYVNLAVFAVSGSTPQDVFSFLRVKHPTLEMYEYRFRPFNSAIYAQQSGGNVDVFEVNGALTDYQERTFDTYMGTFTVGGRGRFIKPIDYFTHSQMVDKPKLLNDMVYGEWVPSPTVDINGSVQFLSITRTSDNVPMDWITVSNVFAQKAALDPYFNDLPIGYIHTIADWTYNRDSPQRSIVMKVTLKAVSYVKDGTPRNKWWEVVKTEIASISGTWSNDDTFVKTARGKDDIQYNLLYRVNGSSTYTEFDKPISDARIWETYSGIAEVSHYGDLIARSCDSGPEHQIVYVNESVAEDDAVNYKGCAMMGLKLQSSNNFSSLDQVRCYIKNGLEVERLTDGGFGPSNLFTDLLWYLATNRDTGAGGIIDPSLLDRDQLAATGSYLRENRLFFDDTISQPTNLRTWLSEKAPSMLCFVAIKNGKLSVNPALPTDSSGVVTAVAPAISAMFTDGNIIEGSFSLEWLELEERKLFQAAVIYRRAPLNKLPQQETVVVRYANSGSDALPLEEFTLPHITSKSHAVKAAKYFLALRKHITHTITFQTLPYGLSLAPGEFIMVAVEQSPYSPANNGIVKADGTVISVTALADGTHDVYYWDRSQSEVGEGALKVANGVAQNLRNTVFSLRAASVATQVYQVEALDVDQDGIVTVKASSFPVDSQGRSLVAADVVSDSNFEIVGQGED